MQQTSRQVTSVTHSQHLLSQHEITTRTTLNPITTIADHQARDTNYYYINDIYDNNTYGYENYNNNNNIYQQEDDLQTIDNEQAATQYQHHNNYDDDNNLQYLIDEQRSSENNSRQQPQQQHDPNARDSLTIALEEIGAIVDGKEFTTLSLINQQQQQQQQQRQANFSNNNTIESNSCQRQIKFIKKELIDIEQQLPQVMGQGVKVEKPTINNNNNTQHIETQVSIYESLKQSIINEPDDHSDITMATTNQQHQINNNNNNISNNNTNHYADLFTRCVAGPEAGISAPSASTNVNILASEVVAKQPYVEIIEQPAKCALRFRYKCEGRSAGSLPGVNSTSENKTFPTIRINNYIGRAVVVISCVTKEAPYKAHPHNIVGKEGCKKGICTIVMNNNNINNKKNTDDDHDDDDDDEQEAEQEVDESTQSPPPPPPAQPKQTPRTPANSITRTFNGLGVQCVKRRDIEESLSLRESINVDPFRNGFAHKLDTSNIDLNVVRLCFQVFIEGNTPNKCDIPLTPIVSDIIHDKKAMSDLVITKLSHCSAPATGGREVILLCDRISKDDIQVRFFEEREGELIWETYSEISPADVHKQVAICLRTPKYYNEHITQPVMARVQLRRISDNQVSEPRLFQFLPCESDEDIISRKRQKIEWVNINHYALDNILQQPAGHSQQQSQSQPHPHHHQQQQQQQHQQQLQLIQQPHLQHQQQQQHQISHLHHQPQASHSSQRQQQ